MTFVLETQNLEKRYGRNYALEPLNMRIRSGSVHGLLGKNGAGKSTLVSMIAGFVSPTGGKIVHNGVDITDTSHQERKALGINLMGQHAELVGQLSVAENLLMPELSQGRMGWVSWPRVRREAQQILERYRLAIDVDMPVSRLSIHEQRRLSIAKTLRDRGSLAMLDEPTASLTRDERDELFEWIRELNQEGQTFVFISHYSGEIRQICDECTVLRDGRLVATEVDPRTISTSEISELVTGASVREFQRSIVEETSCHMSLRDVSASGVGPVSLEIGRGQIAGFVGLPGSGAKELARALGGMRPIISGDVVVASESIDLRNVKDAHKSGLVYVTDDRTEEGLVPEFSIMESLRLGNWPVSHGLIDNSAIKHYFKGISDRLQIRCRDQSQRVAELSGGNQQKVLLGAMLGFEPQIVILDEPTLGVDVGTKVEIYSLMDELTRHGVSIILLSNDSDEMCHLADVVYAFQDERLVRVLTGSSINPDAILDTLKETVGVVS